MQHLLPASFVYLYRKNNFVHERIIVITFTFLGTTYFHLSYRKTINLYILLILNFCIILLLTKNFVHALSDLFSKNSNLLTFNDANFSLLNGHLHPHTHIHPASILLVQIAMKYFDSPFPSLTLLFGIVPNAKNTYINIL